MKESTIENNINKSINALKINELGYAKEYVNRILVEVPDHALAIRIREYILLLKSKESSEWKREKFFFDTIVHPMANEMFPLIEFLCTTFETYRLGSDRIEKFIEKIEKCNLNNEVLNNFYEELKVALPIERAKEQARHEEWENESRKKIRRKVLIILVVVAVVVLIYLSMLKII